MKIIGVFHACIINKKENEMKRKKFTDKEKTTLLKNIHILKVGDGSVTYSFEFKLNAVKEYLKGKSPLDIYVEAGIDIDIIGKKVPSKNIFRWKTFYQEKGENSLIKDLRGVGKGRPRKNPLTIKEAEARIAYLEAENEFLKKLDLLERGLI